MKQSSFTGVNLRSAPSKGSYNTNSPLLKEADIIPANKRGNYFHHIPAVGKMIYKIKAYFIVSGVKSALKEVELIEKGVKKPKSLDQVLNEL